MRLATLGFGLVLSLFLSTQAWAEGPPAPKAAAPVAAPAPAPAPAAAPAAAPTWDAWRPLVGEWVGEGGGKPGEGTGGFSFAFELQEKVLVRKNQADYPAAGGKPASRHEDLMVLWNTPAGTRATYWDNEGHVIDYRCTAGAGRWTCETSGGAPGFRLEYALGAGGELGITFSISPTGKAEGFKAYLTAAARRR